MTRTFRISTEKSHRNGVTHTGSDNRTSHVLHKSTNSNRLQKSTSFLINDTDDSYYHSSTICISSHTKDPIVDVDTIRSMAAKSGERMYHLVDCYFPSPIDCVDGYISCSPSYGVNRHISEIIYTDDVEDFIHLEVFDTIKFKGTIPEISKYTGPLFPPTESGWIPRKIVNYLLNSHSMTQLIGDAILNALIPRPGIHAGRYNLDNLEYIDIVLTMYPCLAEKYKDRCTALLNSKWIWRQPLRWERGFERKVILTLVNILMMHGLIPEGTPARRIKTTILPRKPYWHGIY